MFADYFTVAVRTGGPGAKGLSFLLLEKSMPGITCKQMDCSGVWASGTAFITFDNVEVPVSNLIGAENEGFKYVMYNFNHERWGFIVQATRFARVCLVRSPRLALATLLARCASS
jgi:alkylation response protein AidB-like acyl-CoA dehydrogenase